MTWHGVGVVLEWHGVWPRLGAVGAAAPAPPLRVKYFVHKSLDRLAICEMAHLRAHHSPWHHSPSHHTPSHHTASHHTPAHHSPVHLSVDLLNHLSLSLLILNIDGPERLSVSVSG